MNRYNSINIVLIQIFYVNQNMITKFHSNILKKKKNIEKPSI